MSRNDEFMVYLGDLGFICLLCLENFWLLIFRSILYVNLGILLEGCLIKNVYLFN